MRRKTQITSTPKKRRGRKKSTCSEYDRTGYFKKYYDELKNDPERMEKKRTKNREWARSKNGKRYKKDYYNMITKQKRKIKNEIIKEIKKEQIKKANEYCPVKPGQCEQLNYNEFNEKICHKFNDEIISLWCINHCPAEKESK